MAWKFQGPGQHAFETHGRLVDTFTILSHDDLLLLVFLQNALELVEPCVPELEDFLEPAFDLAESFRIESVDSALRVFAHRYESGLAKHFQMLRYGRAAHLESIGKSLLAGS